MRLVPGSNVQLTTPIGSISDETIDLGNNFSHSKTSSESANTDGSYSHGSAANSGSSTTSKQDVKPDSGEKTSSDQAKKAGASVSVSGSFGKGEDEATHIHSDINGDGFCCFYPTCNCASEDFYGNNPDCKTPGPS
jgi:hypothetical protein